MAADKIMGIRLRINSDAATTGIERMRRAVAAAKSESKAFNSVLGDWKKTSEGLEAQIASLNKQEQARKQYIEELRQSYEGYKADEDAHRSALDLLIQKYGEESSVVADARKELDKLAARTQAQGKKLNEQITTYNNLIDETKKYEKMLNDLTSDYTLAEAELRSLIRASKDASKDVKVLEKSIELQSMAVRTAEETLMDFIDKQSKLEDGSAEWKVMQAQILDAEGALAEANKKLEDTRLKLIEINNTGSLEDLQQNAIQSKAHLDTLASSIDDCENSMEYMRAADKALSDELNYQKALLDSLKNKLDDVEAEFGSTSDAAHDLKNQIKLQEDAVSKAKIAFDKQTSATEKLESSTRGLNKVLTFCKQHINDVKNENALLNDGFTVLKGTISHLASHGLEALFGRLHVLLGTSRELRKELGMLQATAETTGKMKSEKDVEKAKGSLRTIYGITEDTSGGTEAISNLLTAGFNYDNVGPTLDAITRQLLGASIKWKDTLSMEGLSDSIQEAIGSKGMSVTGQFAELIERMGFDIEVWKKEFSSLGTEAERQDKIYQTLASGGLEDVLKKYEEINGSLIEENEAVYDTMLTSQRFTEAVNPLVISLQQGYNKLMETFVEFAETHKKEIEQIQSYISKFFDILSSGFKWVLENLELVAGVIGAMLAAKWSIIAVAGVSKIIDSVSTLGAKVLTVGSTAEEAAEKLAMLGGKKIFGAGLLNVAKIGGIGLAIGAVIAALVLLYQKSEEFRNFVDEFFGKLVEIGKGIWESLKPALESIGNALVNLIMVLGEILMPILKLIGAVIINDIGPKLEFFADIIAIAFELIAFAINAIVARIKTFIEFWKAIFATLKALVTGDTEKISEIWSNFGDKIKDIWGNVWKGLVEGLTKGFKNLWDSFKNLCTSWINWIKDLFGIHSPSTLFAGFGKNMMEGLLNGISGMFGKIKDKITSIAEKISETFKSAVSLVKDVGGNIVSGLWNGINSKIDWVKKKITDFCSSIGTSIVDFFKIDSPSKWGIEKGQFIAQGVGIGVLNGASDALKNVNKFNDKISNGFGLTGTSTATAGGSKIINAGLTVQYNKELSLKEISKLESKYYSNIRKLK